MRYFSSSGRTKICGEFDVTFGSVQAPPASDGNVFVGGLPARVISETEKIELRAAMIAKGTSVSAREVVQAAERLSVAELGTAHQWLQDFPGRCLAEAVSCRRSHARPGWRR
jgi:hypothetical protein